MNCNASSTDSDKFRVGSIVWGRRNSDGIYWPGKINFISHDLGDVSNSNSHLQYQPYSYLVLFFGYDQTHWTVDVLPYRQYRDYMSRNSLIHYDAYPSVKHEFLNAMNQADCADASENCSPIKYDDSMSFDSNKTHLNHNYVSTSTAHSNSVAYTTNDYSMNYYSPLSNTYHQYPSNCSYVPHSSPYPYYSYCPASSTPSTDHLSIDTNLNTTSHLDNEYHSIRNPTTGSDIRTLSNANSIVIITTKDNAHSSLVSHLLTCLSTHFHPSVVYIDHLTNYEHPPTSTISYLVCLDRFDATIQQTLDSTILNNLSVHINYLFVVINAPSHDLVQHMYGTVMDKRTVIIGHYQSSFENEAVLLCSGYRRTFELARSSLLKYLRSKIEYVESSEEQFYRTDDLSIASQTSSANDQTISDSSLLINERHPPKSLLRKSTKKLGRPKKMDHLDGKISKHHMSKTKLASTSPSKCSVQNILGDCNSSQ